MDIEKLSELDRQIARMPGWRTQVDPKLVAEVYRHTAHFDLVEKWADGYLYPEAFLKEILATDATDFNGDVVLAFIAKQDAEMAEMNRALSQGLETRKPFYIIRFFFVDGDGFDRYEDHSFYTNKEKADHKCAELNASFTGGYIDDEYRVVEAEMETD